MKINPLLKAQTCIEVTEDGECLGEEGESVEDDSLISTRTIFIPPKRCKKGYRRDKNNKCRKVIKTYNIRSTTVRS